MSKEKEKSYIYRRHLPHFRSEGNVYFVTWRLQRGQADLDPSEKDEVVQCLKFFDEKRYHLFGYVVMNDHVHVIVWPGEGYRLEAITHSWKSFSAHALTKNGNREEHLWQHESFDRIVRSDKELFEKMHYVFNNPLKRWSDVESNPWVWCKGMDEPNKGDNNKHSR